ncbi:sulfatase-like hydrolase/transferase [Pontiella sulfatireligans]|uniref:Arylsulfatase n=1 Tax=Pontiella sulfatireligans TaxID=2750658 RepID=A0A6C2UH77_9BACT|nr:sulfatase-like hydrolase/transferase [Pontiella sulfatireligans]SPS74191.1 sulfatase S1_24 [Kiritimatiellales bacterium]VGO18556.1 Arylsulfatase [Pontiella sulfatireligans]
MKTGWSKKFVVPPLGGLSAEPFLCSRLKAGLHTFACIILTMSCAVAEKPNVVVIMVDDLGAETLGCYGSTSFSTPNLDRLASQGARFENAYGTPSCSPSRAMIVSGLYSNRSGILERLGAGTPNCLPGHIPTFGDLFQENGYKTGITGKWHIGDFDRYPEHPQSHGFAESFMWAKYYKGVDYSNYFNPGVIDHGELQVRKGEYGPNLFCDYILNFIEQNKEGPFLAYYPMVLVHKNFHNPPEKEGVKHFFPESAGDDNKKYALMVSYMDMLVGRILDKLDALGLTDNTLVIFTADNGSPNAILSQLGDLTVRGGKLSLIESGYRIPFIARWPRKIPVGTRDQFMTLADVFPTLAGLTGLSMTADVNGMDLSHNFFGKPGEDRDYVYIAWEGGFYFVRDKRFRLHEDGKLYDIPVSSNGSRYSEKLSSITEHPEEAQRLQAKLDEFKKIQKTDESYTIIPFKGYKKWRAANNPEHQAKTKKTKKNKVKK